MAALAEIPRASMLQFFRHLWSARADMLGVARDLEATLGPVCLQKTPLIDMVTLFGPDAVKRVLLDRDETLSARRSWNIIMGRIFRDGLLLRDGEDHRLHRGLMQAAFRKEALGGYVERMNPWIEETLRSWTGRRHAFDAFKLLTLDLACRVFVGMNAGEDVRRLNRAFEDAVAASMSVVRLPLPGLEYTRGLAGRAWMIDFFGGLLESKRNGESPDMFGRLARAEDDSGGRFTDEDVIDHMIFLMMAAHDTTTSTLTSMVYELARHPEWQERVREESRELGVKHVGIDDMARLSSLDLVLQEVLRRYPPLSTIPRVSTREFEWMGYRVPTDVMVVVYPIHTHHMEAWWDEPFRFDPERFAEPRSEHRRHTHSWVPFGGGAHTCIGLVFAELQVKAILHQLVGRYRWRVPDGYVLPVQQAPISKPTDGLPLEFQRLRSVDRQSAS